MASRTIRNLMQRGRAGYAADTKPVPKPPLLPTEPPELPRPRTDMTAGGEGERGGAEQAYEQVRSGLQALVAEYPEAQGVLDQIESLWSKWMGGGQAEAGEPGEAAKDTAILMPANRGYGAPYA